MPLLSFFLKVTSLLFLFCFRYTINNIAKVTAFTNPTNAQINQILQDIAIVLSPGIFHGIGTATALRVNQMATFTNGQADAGIIFLVVNFMQSKLLTMKMIKSNFLKTFCVT